MNYFEYLILGIYLIVGFIFEKKVLKLNLKKEDSLISKINNRFVVGIYLTPAIWFFVSSNDKLCDITIKQVCYIAFGLIWGIYLIYFLYFKFK